MVKSNQPLKLLTLQLEKLKNFTIVTEHDDFYPQPQESVSDNLSLNHELDQTPHYQLTKVWQYCDCKSQTGSESSGQQTDLASHTSSITTETQTDDSLVRWGEPMRWKIVIKRNSQSNFSHC